MEKDIEKFYEVALELVKQAGKLIRDRLNEKKSVEIKSCDIDFVTETDKQVEQLLIDGLSETFPSHKFIGEESVAGGAQCSLSDDPTWIIDPVDGTLNFVHGFPHSCISLGLFIKKEPEIGIIYNPNLEQLFTAKKSQGAFLNGKRIHVSDVTKLSDSLIVFENGTSRDVEKFKVLCENYQTLVPLTQGMRSLGSAALNMTMVAMGGADVYFEYGTHIWDIAAGELIVKEAGGVFIDPCGGDVDRMSRRFLCASTQSLADELSKKLVQYYPLPTD